MIERFSGRGFYPNEPLTPPKLEQLERRSEMTDAEIDRQVSAAAASGEPLYTVDRALLSALAPQLVLSQAICDVCAARDFQGDGGCVRRAAGRPDDDGDGDGGISVQRP